MGSISAKQTNQIVNMKFLGIASACIAAASASRAGVPLGPANWYTGPLGDGPATVGFADTVPASVAVLVGHPNGAVVPADTPAVNAARADHLAAKGAVYAPAAPIVAAAPVAVAAPAIAAPAIAAVPAVAYGAYGYAGPLADSLPASAAGLVSLPNGAVVPKDTPSVVAARADHLAAKGAVYAAAAPALPVAGPAYAAGVVPVGAASPTGALVSFPNGAVVPADEPAVVAARADHLAAKGGLGW